MWFYGLPLLHLSPYIAVFFTIHAYIRVVPNIHVLYGCKNTQGLCAETYIRNNPRVRTRGLCICTYWDPEPCVPMVMGGCVLSTRTYAWIEHGTGFLSPMGLQN